MAIYSLPTAPLPRGSSSSVVRASDWYSEGSRFNPQLGPVFIFFWRGGISLLSQNAYHRYLLKSLPCTKHFEPDVLSYRTELQDIRERLQNEELSRSDAVRELDILRRQHEDELRAREHAQRLAR